MAPLANSDMLSPGQMLAEEGVITMDVIGLNALIDGPIMYDEQLLSVIPREYNPAVNPVAMESVDITTVPCFHSKLNPV